MVDTVITQYFIAGILTSLCQIGIWLVCLLLLIRERSWPSILTFTGISLVIVGGIMGLLAQTLLGRSGPEELARYQGIIYIVNAVCYFVFATGLILLIVKYMRLSRFVQLSKAQ